jgi:AraC family transcriptional regulator
VDPVRPAARQQPVTSLVVTLRGRYRVRHVGGQVVFDPTRAVMHAGGEEYVSCHPDGGDECLLITSDLLAATYEPWQVVPLDVPAQLRLSDLAARLQAGSMQVLEVQEILAEIFDPDRAPPRRGTRRARVLAEEIAQQVAAHFDQALPLESLAGQLGVSPFAACRLFRSATGWTIHQYQLELRLRHALTLLYETQQPLASIALQTGFANQGHFGNHFRRRYGLTPGQARTADGKRVLAPSTTR